MRFAYADPPYLNCAHLYKELHPDALKWNDPETHRRLLESLDEDYPDGWAYSLTSTSLRTLLPFCPEDVRVLSWSKPFCNWKGSVNPAYAWEPVLVRGGRSRKLENPKVLDFLVCNAPLQTGCPGAKPTEFAMWLFRVLGAVPGDELADLFPGSGNVGRAWDVFNRQLSLYA
jgi:hypothetical protein